MNREYNSTSIFDNEEVVEGGEFSLERLASSAAQRVIQSALELEVSEFLERLRYEKSPAGAEPKGYRNGHHRERVVATAVGGLSVRVPRVSDSIEKFESKLVRPYKRRSAELDTTFQKLFIEGLATRDFEPALRALTGTEAALSPSSISRLNKQFKDDYDTWSKRDLRDLKIAYSWVDGVSLAAGIADERAHLLVVIGVDMTGTKRLISLTEGQRESKESWGAVLRDLKKRGLNQPALAVADGALGFWAALPGVWPLTKQQQCWFHKTRNILDKLATSEQKEGVQRLRGIQQATDREAAQWLATKLIKDWRDAGYDRAAKCLESALERLLTFYDFPPEHAKHLRTTNPVESPFATMRIRTNAARRFRTSKSGLHLVFKLFERIEKSWRKIKSPEKLKEVKLPT